MRYSGAVLYFFSSSFFSSGLGVGSLNCISIRSAIPLHDNI